MTLERCPPELSADLVDRSDRLGLLTEHGEPMPIPIANADEVLRPDPPWPSAQ